MHNIIRKLIHFFIILVLFTSFTTAQEKLVKENSRMPFTEKNNGFITEWLVIGGFRSDNNFETDFLSEAGGETNIKPVKGMEIKDSSGSVYTWGDYSSRYNYINFFDALDGQNFSSSAIYAYAEVTSQKDMESVFSFGILGSSKIWLNGDLVHSDSEYGSSQHENTQVKVNLKKGQNRILLKSASGGWTSGFRFRIIDPLNFSSADNFVLNPKIISEKSVKDKLVILTDQTLNPYIQEEIVNIKVRAAGGKIVEEIDVKRAEEVTLDTDDWDDGTYDICFSVRDNKDKIMTANILWYKGEPLNAVQDLVFSLPKEIKSEADILQKMLKDMIFDRLAVDDLSKADPKNFSKIYSPLMEYEELLLEKEGKTGRIRSNGFVRFAWIDPIDNTPQFLRVYLPLNYDPNRKYPVMLRLHGYNGANPEYINWWSVDNRHTNSTDKYNMIFADPHGRGNTGYRGLGEQDIIRCVEIITKNLSVAKDSIYLYGESMGGGGTWYVGSRHPEIFAAIAPVYGGWDYHSTMSEEDIEALSEKEKYNLEAYSSFAQADALLTTPILVSHGDIDRAVDVKCSRFAVKMIQRWGYDIRYHEYPGFGHEGIDLYDEVVPWLKKHSLNSNPKKVRVRAAELGTAKAHWINVIQRFDPFEFIQAEAEVLKKNTIRLTTENVAEIKLSPSELLLDYSKLVTVIWNAKELIKVDLKNGSIILKEKNYSPGKLVKTPAIAGPLSDITNTPFAVVIGTISEDSLMNVVCKQKAQEFIDNWKQWQKFEPRVFMDTEITEKEMKEYSLILYGGANENLVVKNFGDKIPLIITETKITLQDQEFDVKDAGIKMIYPNPYNGNRYVQINAGTSAGGFYLLDNGNDYDFSINDGCVPNKSEGRTMSEIIVARGMFNHNWEIENRFMDKGDDELRKNAPYKVVDKNLTISYSNIKDVDTEKYDSYVGKYHIAPHTNIIIRREVDRLIATGPEGDSSGLIPVNDNAFILVSGDNEIRITFVEEDGKVTTMLVDFPNRPQMEAKKVE